MKSLIFKKLVLLSDLEQKGIELKFHKKINVVVGSDNSVGKSTLVKNLFWALGCEPYFDDVWKNADCKSLIEFSINGIDYKIARHGQRIFLSEAGKPYKVFSKLTGDYAKEFSRLVNFNAILTDRNKAAVSTPPPAYYFLPFYIDQIKSWSSAWAGFDKLGQYDNWKKDIIPYHCGAFDEEYFHISDEIHAIEMQKEDVETKIDRIDTAISVVNEFIPQITTTIDVTEFNEIRKELEDDLADLHIVQEDLFEEVATLKAEKMHLERQLKIAEESLNEVELDYEFALKNSEQAEMECPTCGTLHDNTLVERFSILQDNDQAEQICIRIGAEIEKVDHELNLKSQDLNDIKVQIDKLNKKFYKDEKDTRFTLSSILDSVASHSVKYKVESSRKENADNLVTLSKNKRKIQTERTKSVRKHKKEVFDKFRELFPKYVTKLGATGVNTNSINSPTTHGKVSNSGGAAEGTRAMLAYYVAIYNLASLYNESALAPLVIDTPNQHEQARDHYKAIVRLLLENTPEEAQIFLCGMDDKALKPIKNQGKVFELSDLRSLLQKTQYKKAKEHIGSVFA